MFNAAFVVTLKNTKNKVGLLILQVELFNLGNVLLNANINFI